MKKKLALLLMILMPLYLIAKNKASDTITINVNLKTNEFLRLRYLDEYLTEKVLTFKNNSTKDSIFSTQLYTRKPVEFRYSLLVEENKTLRNYYYNFVLNPGANFSIKLKDNYEIVCLDANAKMVFASEQLNLFNPFDITENNKTKEILHSGIEKYDIYIDKVYRSNLKKLDSISANHLITDETEKSWKNLIIANYYMQLLSPRSVLMSKRNDDFEKKIVDTKQQLNQLKKIDSYALKTILNNLIKYEIMLLGKTTNDIGFYTQYMIQSGWEPEVIIGSLIENFNTYPEKNSIPFRKAFDEFKNFCKKNGKEETAVQLSSKYFPPTAIYNKILLVNAAGKPSTLNQILKKEKGKIVFIDLWASWCKPCRAEIPVLEKIKKKFSAQHIEFISISLDKNGSTQAWETALKQEKLKDKHQYRMLDVSNAALSKAFQVESIPRYLVFDRNGNTLNDNFPKPSDRQFEHKLQNYLKL